MRVLVTDKETANRLNGKYANDCYLQFTEAETGIFIVGENVLRDENFKEIFEQLKELPQIEYELKTDNEKV